MADAYDTELDNLRRKILKEADQHIENSRVEASSKQKCVKLQRNLNDLVFQNKHKEDKLERLREHYSEIKCVKLQNCTLKGRSLNELRQNFSSKPLSIGNQRKLLAHIISQIHSYQELLKKEESERQRLGFMRARKSSLSRSFNKKLKEVHSLESKFKDLDEQVQSSKYAAHFQWLKEEHELEAARTKYIKTRSDRDITLHSFRKQEKRLKEKVSRVATSLAKSSLCLKYKRQEKQDMIKSIKHALKNRSLHEKSLVVFQSQLQSFQDEFAALRTVVDMVKKGNTPADMTGFVDCVLKLWEKMRATETNLKFKYGEICDSHCKLSLELEDLKNELSHTNASVEIYYKLTQVKNTIGVKSITSNQIHDVRLKDNADTEKIESYERVCINVYSFFQWAIGRIKKQVKLINLYALNDLETAINGAAEPTERRASNKRYMKTTKLSELGGSFMKVKKQVSSLTERNHREALANDISNAKVIADILAPKKLFGYKLSDFLQFSEIFKLFLVHTDLCKILKNHSPVSELSFTVILKRLYEKTHKTAMKSISNLMIQVQTLLDIIGLEQPEPLSREMQSVQLKTDRREASKLLKMVINIKQKLRRREKKLKKEEDVQVEHHRFKISPFIKGSDPKEDDRDCLLKSNRSVRTKQVKHHLGIPKLVKLGDFGKDLTSIKKHFKVLKSAQSHSARVFEVSPR